MREFIEMVSKKCAEAGVVLDLRPVSRVSADGDFCSGFFDPATPRIVVATRRRKSTWLGVLAHEYAHMEQWQGKGEGGRLWREAAKADYFYTWVKGPDFRHRKKAYHAMRRVQALELHAEQRAVELIKKYNLPIDIKKYTQYANAYILSHNYMWRYGCWFRTKGPTFTQNRRLVNALPGHWLEDYSCLPPEMELLFDTHFIKPVI